MVRSVGAVGTFVLGLHKKREKVHHPGLQHVTLDPHTHTILHVTAYRIMKMLLAVKSSGGTYPSDLWTRRVTTGAACSASGWGSVGGIQ